MAGAVTVALPRVTAEALGLLTTEGPEAQAETVHINITYQLRDLLLKALVNAEPMEWPKPMGRG